MLSCVPVLAAACAAAAGQPARMTPADLLERAEAQGSVRVIVDLRVVPAGIGAAQDAVLGELAGSAHRVTRRFTAIPHLALEASAEALRRLAASPHVVGIQEDRLLRPQERAPQGQER